MGAPLDPYHGFKDIAELCDHVISTLFNSANSSSSTSSSSSSSSKTDKDSSSVPNLAEFIAYSLYRTRLPTSIVHQALLLLHRLKSRYPSARGTSTSPHRLFLSSLMLSSKISMDDTYSNKSWQIVGQGLFSLREVNQMERELFAFLGWNVVVKDEELLAWINEVVEPFEAERQQQQQQLVDEPKRGRRRVSSDESSSSSSPSTSRSSSRHRRASDAAMALLAGSSSSSSSSARPKPRSRTRTPDRERSSPYYSLSRPHSSSSSSYPSSTASSSCSSSTMSSPISSGVQTPATPPMMMVGDGGAALSPNPDKLGDGWRRDGGLGFGNGNGSRGKEVVEIVSGAGGLIPHWSH